MELSEKLRILRKDKGLSQEELADALSVSRQAVGKWENGISYPELDKLVQISDLYRISLDRLLRNDDECNLNIIRNNKSYDKKAIIEFLLRAKKATYAGNGSKIQSSRRNSSDLNYREGDLYYYDTYLGSESFVGEEAVWEKEDTLWSMNYCGRVIGEHFSSDFLKEALSAVTYDEPFRGPVLFQRGDYTYHCKTDGKFEWFQGYEEIFLKDTKIYECYFHGGSLN